MLKGGGGGRGVECMIAPLWGMATDEGRGSIIRKIAMAELMYDRYVYGTGRLCCILSCSCSILAIKRFVELIMRHLCLLLVVSMNSWSLKNEIFKVCIILNLKF